MATITTYALLQSTAADYVERSDLTARLPTWVANAEAKANRILRERQQQGQSTASVSTALSSLPTDFREVITVQVRSSASDPYSRLDPAPSDVVALWDSELASTGRPRFWGVLGAQLLLYPAPDAAYTVLMTYFAKVPALSDAATSNWLLVEGPDVYLDGVLAGFYEFDRDFEAANRSWQKFENGLVEIISQRKAPPAKLRVDAGLVRGRSYNINTDV